MSKLILVRHGETEKNVSGLTHSTGDPEVLNEKGIKQIGSTADYLQGFNVGAIYCSREKRAVQSGEIIAKSLGLSAKLVDGFQERNWGVLSGKPWAEIKEILDPMTLEERFLYEPPRGESWKVFEERLIKTLKVILKDNPGKNIVVISHGGAIRALMPFLLGLPKEESFKYDPDNASLTIFEILGDERFKSLVLNDTSHLPSN